MRTVWKFPLQFPGFDKGAVGRSVALGPLELEMPAGASVLAVAVQAGVPVLWALVDPRKPPNKRTFILVGTGHGEVPSGFLHVGTFQLDWFVGHVFLDSRA